MKTRAISSVLLSVALWVASAAYAGPAGITRIGGTLGEAEAAGTGCLLYGTYQPETDPGGAYVNFGEPTADGGYILTGKVGEEGVTLLHDVWVVKVAGDGTIDWHKSFGVAGLDQDMDDVGECVRQTADGGYVVAGSTYASGPPVGADVLVMKLDANGGVEWQTRYGAADDPPGWEGATFVEQTADGGYVLAVEYQWLPGGFTVLKLDASGAIQAQARHGKGFARARSIQQTSDTGYIVAGRLDLGGDNNDVWVFKLNGDLSVAWQKRYGGDYWDGAESVRQTSDGGYIVAGETRSWGAGNADAWVLKLGTKGGVVWQKAYGGAGYDKAESVWPTSDGGYLVAGVTESYGGAGEAWVLKLTGDGAIVWERHWGSDLYDGATSAREKDGGYFVSGTIAAGTHGAAGWAVRLDSDGTIPDCDAIGTSASVVTSTSAIPAVTQDDPGADPKPLPLAAIPAGLTPVAASTVFTLVCSGTMEELPNLTPYKPATWSDKIVVSRVTGTSSDDAPLYTTDDLYVDLAVRNVGPGPAADPAEIDLYVDGTRVRTWLTAADMAPTATRRVTDYAIGRLAVGDHVLQVVVDDPPRVQETNESDNQYARTITVAELNGYLSVYISPAGAASAGARWSVDGGATWRESGETIALAEGLYTLVFSSAAGWNLPGSQSVSVTGGETSTAYGTYLPQTGSLRVTIEPADAASAGAMWAVDDGAWQASGAVVSGLSVGVHAVKFKTVTGWKKPVAQSVTIASGETQSVTGTYVRQTGALRVTLGPADAVSAGARWAVDGGEWRVSGTLASGLPVGAHTVTFKAVAGWTTPASQSVTISTGVTTAVTGTYVQHTGSLQVSIEPAGAVGAGARWAVDAGEWQVSGALVSGLPVGAHTVTFEDVAGWTTPTSQAVTILRGKTTSIVGQYQEILLPNLAPHQPAGWSDRIVVSRVKGTHADDAPLTSLDDLYVDVAMRNKGNGATARSTRMSLFVNGALVKSWWTPAVMAPGASMSRIDYGIGRLAVGSHQLRVVVDEPPYVEESNEADNVYVKTIAVEEPRGPNLVPYKPDDWPDAIVVYPKEGFDINDRSLYAADDLYVDTAIANIGTLSAAGFHVTLYIDGVVQASWLKRNAAQPDWYYWWKRINIGQLSAGTHQVRLVVDSHGEVAETVEGDNEYARTIEVKELLGARQQLRAPVSPGGLEGVLMGSSPLKRLPTSR